MVRNELCPCCGTPWRVAFAALDAVENEEIEKMVKIWGEATMMRIIFPEGPAVLFGLPADGWDDPVWDRGWDQLRAGRAGYPDDTPGNRKAGKAGSSQILALIKRIREMKEQEQALHVAPLK